ncbi:unnamed protein product [Rotaria sp. Silwood1]|nr:unnamed protein product [Rotaria sp. Silwood1]
MDIPQDINLTEISKNQSSTTNFLTRTMLPDQDSTATATTSKRDDDKPTLYETEQQMPFKSTTNEHSPCEKGSVKQTSIKQHPPLPLDIAYENTKTLISDVPSTDTAAASSFIEEDKNCQLSSSTTAPTNNTIFGENLLQTFVLVWLNLNIDETDDVFRNSMTQLRRIVNSINTFTDPTRCINFLSRIKDAKVLMIVSGAQCEDIVPQVHDMTQLDSIYLFSSNMIHYEQSANG